MQILKPSLGIFFQQQKRGISFILRVSDSRKYLYPWLDFGSSLLTTRKLNKRKSIKIAINKDDYMMMLFPHKPFPTLTISKVFAKFT